MTAVRKVIKAFIVSFFLVFRVCYERPKVIDSLNLKLRQIAGFLSNVILDEMSSALFFRFFFLFLNTKKDHLIYTCGNFSFLSFSAKIGKDRT